MRTASDLRRISPTCDFPVGCSARTKPHPHTCWRLSPTNFGSIPRPSATMRNATRPAAIGPRGEPGRAAPAGQFGDEDHVDLAGLRQRQDLLAFGALLLCPGGGFLPDPDDFVASLLGEGA